MRVSSIFKVCKLFTPTELFVVDDFYADPNDVRNSALREGFEEVGRGQYPGRNAMQRILDPHTIAAFEKIIGREIRVRDTDAFGVFRLSLQGDVKGNFIHGDPVPWAGILYLNPSPPEGMGTAFWSHNGTGLIAHPFVGWKDAGFESERHAYEKMVKQDGHDTSKWTLSKMIEGLYNRLIIFDPRRYHSHMPIENFGTHDQDGRLVQLFFFESVQ